MSTVTTASDKEEPSTQWQSTDDDDSNNRVGRKRPNILVTGTPGVGKTATAARIAEHINMIHVNIGEVIQQHKCYDGYDDELQTHILDEDALLDILEPMITSTEEPDCSSDMEEGGRVVDYHSCELFPERWFDLVLVLRTETAVLYDRLTLRGYSNRKREENMECEIMNVLGEEARNSYDPDIVQEVSSNSIQDLDETVRRVQLWYQQWIHDHQDHNV